MARPNFNECELEMITNIAIINYLKAQGHAVYPRLTTQREERQWGWDSGYHLPFLGPTNPDQLSLNFFIQYKISGFFQRSNAVGFNLWNQPFYRFTIQQQRHIGNPNNQLIRLLHLVNQGYKTVYSTNNVHLYSDLFNLAVRHRLCNTLPLLPVSNRLINHRYVSFSNNSAHFNLHSPVEQQEMLSIETLVNQINPTPTRNVFDSIYRLITESRVSQQTVDEEIESLRRLIPPEENIQFDPFLTGIWHILRTHLKINWFYVKID
jgi:hypothetical protein